MQHRQSFLVVQISLTLLACRAFAGILLEPLVHFSRAAAVAAPSPPVALAAATASGVLSQLYLLVSSGTVQLSEGDVMRLLSTASLPLETLPRLLHAAAEEAQGVRRSSGFEQEAEAMLLSLGLTSRGLADLTLPGVSRAPLSCTGGRSCKQGAEPGGPAVLVVNRHCGSLLLLHPARSVHNVLSGRSAQCSGLPMAASTKQSPCHRLAMAADLYVCAVADAWLQGRQSCPRRSCGLSIHSCSHTTLAPWRQQSAECWQPSSSRWSAC
jgi:hypothetical protein